MAVETSKVESVMRLTARSVEELTEQLKAVQQPATCLNLYRHGARFEAFVIVLKDEVKAHGRAKPKTEKRNEI